MAATPANAKAAPTKPPNKAWDEDDGRPKSQVVRFHKIAPVRPAKTNSGPISIPSLIKETEIALATAVERNAPTKFMMAAIKTAVFGFKAPVAIAVALEFAVS